MRADGSPNADDVIELGPKLVVASQNHFAGVMVVHWK